MSALPDRPGLVLDVGAGTGRDAVWLAVQGHEVVAVEPSAAMRKEGQARHPDSRIRWISDRLPGLEQTLRLGLSFDFILLSAVWMHVPPTDRSRAFRKLIMLLKPGGLLAITLRNGVAEPDRGMHPVSRDELEGLARAHGAFLDQVVSSPDKLGRDDISWTQILIRLPDDGTGALPLLRHIVLADVKSSTYKLALLRSVARVADGTAGMTRQAEDYVAVPLGLIALFWIRLFKPLITADLPQTPSNRGMNGLGFIREGFRALEAISHLDLKVSSRFQGANAKALHQALRDASDTIAKMPANYITYPNGGQILKAVQGGRIVQPAEILIDRSYLESFGELQIPTNIWRALERFDAWIEPTLISEWVRLMNGYAESQGRRLDNVVINHAMAWSDPSRDVTLTRRLALDLLKSGTNVSCVWTGKKLAEHNLDIDHCLPWSAWPCDDLWNLMPTQRLINQQRKRERLPSAQRLSQAQDLIMLWWSIGYVSSPNATIPDRFLGEARASLPSLAYTRDPSLDDIFGGIAFQRLRLKQDQQVPEW